MADNRGENEQLISKPFTFERTERETKSFLIGKKLKMREIYPFKRCLPYKTATRESRQLLSRRRRTQTTKLYSEINLIHLELVNYEAVLTTPLLKDTGCVDNHKE